jgi:phosphoribosylaminoimidazole-succinocarboxamide synthase
MSNPVTSSPPPITEIPLFSRGKVRDVYDLGDKLLMVATDRLSAFDVVLPTPIPGKGAILTQLSVFWFNHLGVPSHFISADVKDLPASLDRHRDYKAASWIRPCSRPPPRTTSATMRTSTSKPWKA